MFRDRAQAGAALAKELRGYRGRRDAVVLAVPRGGLPVGAAVAGALELPLDVVLSKKIGHPRDPEFAIGAVSLGGEDLAAAAARSDVPPGYLEAEVARVREGLRRRRAFYRGKSPPVATEGRTVILVDDGAATGRTLLSAVALLRREGASRVVVAVPVAAPDALAVLRRAADEAVCLESPEGFTAIGERYEDFAQVTDEEAAACLS